MRGSGETVESRQRVGEEPHMKCAMIGELEIIGIFCCGALSGPLIVFEACYDEPKGRPIPQLYRITHLTPESLNIWQTM